MLKGSSCESIDDTLALSNFVVHVFVGVLTNFEEVILYIYMNEQIRLKEYITLMLVLLVWLIVYLKVLVEI